MIENTIILEKFLSKNLSKQGLVYPLIGRTHPNAWGNSFCFLMCALLYEKTKDKKWKEKAVVSINAELTATKNRFLDKNIFRWEFKNYSFLKLYPLLLKNNYDKDLIANVKDRILKMQHIESFQTNWIAMRALNFLLRYNLFNLPQDKKNSVKELEKVLKRQNNDGLFWDYIYQNSFQYHAYILALLVQYYEILPTIKLKKAIQDGINFLIRVTDNNGDFNYYGRGQKQIFGYTSAIFTLSKWYKITNDKNYLSYSKLIYNFIKPYIRKGAIVMNKDQKLRAGWYKYNYGMEYLLFAKVYLLLSENFKQIKLPKITDLEIYFPSLNMFVKRTKEYFICLSGNGRQSTEVGCLVNFYPKVINCSGGPPINLIGTQRDYSENYFGIVKNNKNPLYCKLGKLNKKEKEISISYNLRDCKIIQSFNLGKKIILKFKIIPKTNLYIKPLHYVASHKLESSIKCLKRGKIITPEGISNVFESEKINVNKPMEFTVILYKSKSESNPIINKLSGISDVFTVRKFVLFKITEFIHFFKILFFKLIKNPKDFILMFSYNQKRDLYMRERNKNY
ncbi:hypothetical protein HYU23_04580 [Candidatus Woesearchaeota archaeon]|nr:hypothetical protein [Candidatus Woesearchaeota archaeon]